MPLTYLNTEEFIAAAKNIGRDESKTWKTLKVEVTKWGKGKDEHYIEYQHRDTFFVRSRLGTLATVEEDETHLCTFDLTVFLKSLEEDLEMGKFDEVRVYGYNPQQVSY